MFRSQSGPSLRFSLFILLLGCLAAIATALTFGLKDLGATHKEASRKVSSGDLSCDCGPGGTEGIGPITGPKEWCVTQQIFELSQVVAKGGLLAAACPQEGPPDDPSIRDAAIPTIDTPIKTYRLSIHVFRETGGANPAASQADVVNAVANLNANYAPWRIQFTYEWRFVDSTRYRYMDTSESGQMKSRYAISPTTKLNIYVVTHNQGGSWGTFPWDPNSRSPYGGIVLDQPHLLSAAVPSHEVGHCLGLWHSFHGVSEVTQCGDCYEPAGRSAEVGDTTGDKCSDTNPSPRNFNCADPAGTDPCSGNPWLDTPIHNFMSYSLSCATEFTPQQAGRIHAWTSNSLTGWLVLPAPPATPGAPVLTKLGGGMIQIVWADNSNDENQFEVQRETKSGPNWINQQIVATVPANMTSTTNSPGVGTFRYRVRASNSNGASAWSGWTQIKN